MKSIPAVGLRGLAIIAAYFVIFAALPADAEVVITFESDSLGARPNGFASVESPLLTFRDTVGADLSIFDGGIQSIGHAVHVAGDQDGSSLEMNFSVPVNFLSLAFGNDDPGYTNPGDLATLIAFSGAIQVAQVSVVLNRDDIMNQTIQLSGITFNRATFAYTNPAGTPFTGGGAASTGLIEVVDNIHFQPVPEPTAVLAAIAGCGVAGCVGRIRRRQATLCA